MNKFVRTDLEPKLIRQFSIEFPGELSALNQFADKVSRIRVTKKTRFAKPYFNPIKVKFNSYISAPTFEQIVTKHILEPKLESFDKIILSELDEVGNTVSTWEITDAEIQSINFGKHDVKSNKRAKCQIIMKPKHCLLKF